MEVAVCGVSRPRFRRCVKETGAKESAPCQAGTASPCALNHAPSRETSGKRRGGRVTRDGQGSRRGRRRKLWAGPRGCVSLALARPAAVQLPG